MSLSQIVGSMRRRMTWTTAQKVFERNEVPRGRGWDETVAKLRGLVLSDAIVPLTDALKAHTMCGEKSVRFYYQSRAALGRLRDGAAQLEFDRGPLTDAFPLLASDAVLASAPPGPRLIGSEEWDDGLALFFGSVRVMTIREELDPQELPQSAARALGEYDQVIGVTHRRMQAVDVVWVPTNGQYADVRVDLPAGMPKDVGDAAHAQIRQQILTRLGEDFLAQPVNLFSLIEDMYRAPDEGEVVELHFGTTTASIKHERMRRRRNSLRTEAYHVGGSQALDAPIEPFSISILWRLNVGGKRSSPELTLHSTSRVVGGPNPTLYDAYFSHCVGHAEFDFVRDRLLTYLA